MVLTSVRFDFERAYFEAWSSWQLWRDIGDGIALLFEVEKGLELSVVTILDKGVFGGFTAKPRFKPWIVSLQTIKKRICERDVCKGLPATCRGRCSIHSIWLLLVKLVYSVLSGKF